MPPQLNEEDINKRIAALNVLVVDDAEFDRELTLAALKKLNVRSIQVAENGTLAIHKIENALAAGKPFDLVLSDFKMPSKDGQGLLTFIRQDPKLKALAVIMVSGSSAELDVKGFIAMGADNIVVKPVTHETLKEKMSDLFKSSISADGK
jgi:two-component system sensor histidine kinase/response regulator